MARTLFHKHDGGHLGQHEDWYYLVDNEDGSRHVEYEWDHVSVNGGGKSEGTRRFTLNDFLGGGKATAISKLKALLDKGG
ncbi:hypothetical protein FJV80_24610 [Mesorhizobium sp. WSM4310]|uniref:hypothetical protein n=1 Tax=Mesorhizobium sp. WSM4310 TaxID=2589883 RepID=UPI00115E07BF|nr:hypothetical protein [Mesorhizobium sp. WSM4310]TRC78528.1 hypothetical protein FJV80_24610 [Mesorhizobium sp. WSM4310]